MRHQKCVRMKKKLIEISIDENGKFLFETNSDCLGVGDFKLSMSESEFLKKLDPLVESLFVEYFKNKNERLSRIVKLLTVADICADAQPYNNIEELWHVMMHIHLPKYEKNIGV